MLTTLFCYGRKPRPHMNHCIYDHYAGYARIISVKKTPESIAQRSRAGFIGYEILFTLDVDRDQYESKLNDALKTPYLFLLNNGWYPGKAYIEKYGIKVGRKYPGTLKIRRSGYCPRPIFFDEPTLRGDDYFEGYLTKPTPKPQPPIMVKKPMIYLYPKKTEQITVKLPNNQNLTHTYPKYPKDGWKMIVNNNGILTDIKTRKKYYALYWEAKDLKGFTVPTGAVIAGKNSIDYLEKSLTTLGLNWRERNEFIIYWLPYLEKNSYNLIHFVTQEYTDRYPLEISPKPDTIIRVYMVFKKVPQKFKIKKQILKLTTRKGYSVVEWGGSQLQ